MVASDLQFIFYLNVYNKIKKKTTNGPRIFVSEINLLD